MKRTLAVVIAVFMVMSLLLTGCGGQKNVADETNQGQQASQDTKQAEEKKDIGGEKKPVQLTYWTFQGLHEQFFKEAADSWNKANADQPIEFRATTYPYEDMHNKLLISLQSGVGAPDIVDIEISKISNYLKGTPQLLDLTDLVANDRDKFVEARLLIYSKDGKLYGLPTHVGATVMYYNTEMLGKAGVNPDDIKTWDDYVAAGKKVVAATGKPMMTIETRDQWTFWPLISQYKSDYFDKDGNVSLDNETNVKVLQFMKDLIVKEKIAIVTPGGNHHAEEYYGFMNKGGAASVLMPMWYMGRFIEYMPDLKGKIAIRPLPSFGDGTFRSAGMGGTSTSITNQCKNPKMAKKYLYYAKGTREANIKIWTILGFDPPRWDVWDTSELQADNKYTEYFGKDIFKMLLAIKDEIYPVKITEKTPAACDLVKTSVLFKALDEQSLSPEQALKSAADELRK